MYASVLKIVDRATYARYYLWADTGADAKGVCTDSSGNVYVCGERANSKTVWKFDSSGNLLWSADTGDTAHRIKVDSSGNVYVVGKRNNSKSVWKFNSSGSLTHSYDTGDDTNDLCLSDSNVYVVGLAVDKSDPDNAASIWKLTQSNLSLVWKKPFLSAYYCEDAYAVVVDGSGNIYVTGFQAYMYNYYPLIKYDSSGDEVWRCEAVNRYLKHISVCLDPTETYVFIGQDSTGDSHVRKFEASDGDYLGIWATLGIDVYQILCDEDGAPRLAIDSANKLATKVIGGKTKVADHRPVRVYPICHTSSDGYWITFHKFNYADASEIYSYKMPESPISSALYGLCFASNWPRCGTLYAAAVRTDYEQGPPY